MQTKTDKATERPWEIFTKGNYSLAGSRNGWSIGVCNKITNETICLIDCGNKDTDYDTEKANAELIVRAVNNHEALVEACSHVLRNLKKMSEENFENFEDEIAHLEHAISKAQG